MSLKLDKLLKLKWSAGKWKRGRRWVENILCWRF